MPRPRTFNKKRIPKRKSEDNVANQDNNTPTKKASLNGTSNAEILSCESPKNVCVESKSTDEQCSAMCVSLLIALREHNVFDSFSKWNSQVINNVIDMSSLITRSFIQYKCQIGSINSRHLPVYDIVNYVQVEETKYVFDVPDDVIVCGFADDVDGTSCTLQDGLDNFFTFHKDGILNYLDHSILISRVENKFIAFSPHGKNMFGIVKSKNNTCCIRSFDNVRELHDFIVKICITKRKISKCSPCHLIPVRLDTDSAVNVNINANVNANASVVDTGSTRHVKIFRGTVNQSSEIFSVGNRGKQCLGNAAAFFLVQQELNANSVSYVWSPRDVDRVLSVGDQMYTRCVQTRRARNYGNRDHLEADDLVENFTLSNRDFVIGKRYEDRSYGNLCSVSADVPSLLNTLSQFFEDHNKGLFICNGETVAIGKIDNQFSFFDSHSRDEHGNRSSDGVACLLYYDSIDGIHDHMLRLFCKQAGAVQSFELNVYEIVPLTVVMFVRPVETLRAATSATIEQQGTSDFNSLNIRDASITVSPPRGPLPPPPPLSSFSSVGPNRSPVSVQDDAESDIVLNIPGATLNRANFACTFQAASRTDVAYFDVGDFSKTCRFCNARFFSYETEFCCRKGAVVLPPPEPYPELLTALLNGDHPDSGHFISKIRRYNNALSFASINSRVRQDLGRGVPVYVISGVLHHVIADIGASSEPTYGQLYFVDAAEANNVRQQNANDLSPVLLQRLDELLRENNPFAQLYRQLRETIEIERGRNVDAVTELGILFFSKPGINRRTHNVPTNPNEIGVVFKSGDANIPELPTLRVHYREANQGRRFMNISKISPLADPLCYPILFPYGTLGWQVDIPLSTRAGSTHSRVRVTIREYYLYNLMVRTDPGLGHSRITFNVLIMSRKLSQQFITDAYVKTESDRLTYIRDNQRTLRAQSYEGLQDYVRMLQDRQPSRLGKLIILPSTFNCGPRFMMQLYQDCMAIVARFGRPTYFVTMTCNPRWPEIAPKLLPNQNAEDRPDLVCRVFLLKLRELISDISAKQVFGRSTALVWVIEFQKRGLPHAHILLTVRSEDRIRDADELNKFIRAELPDPVSEPELYQLVTSTMIHGPCDARNPGSHNCQDEITKKCSKGFPKPLRSVSSCVPGQPVTYRRRELPADQHRSLGRNNRDLPIDNRDVVPYNPWLLLKYRSHINVELTSSVKCCKYICKYMSKGPDGAVIQLRRNDPAAENTNTDWDETDEFVESRYVSSCESFWRLASFPMHHISHTVVRLPVHLPNQRVVMFRDGDEGEALELAETRFSMLEAYFRLNARDARATESTYLQIPETYRFAENEWKRRQRTQREPIVVRMYAVSPKNVELFHLRILLLHVRGATSFDDLLRVDGTLCTSFRESAERRHLTTSDDEWVRCLDEASEMNMPGQIRRIFAYMLLYCQVSNPQALWNRYRRFMSESFTRRGFSERDAERKALIHIGGIIRAHGQTMSQFGFDPEFDAPPPLNDRQSVENNDDLLTPPPSGGAQDLLAQNVASLNRAQRDFFDTVMAAVEGGDDDVDGTAHNRYFYLQGSGGTGKTFLYNVLLDALASRDVGTISVAFTGIASLLLRNGRTAHSTFRLPLAISECTTSSITAQSPEANRFRRAKLLIWDEITMTGCHVIDVVDRLLRDVRGNREPFGGICAVFGGDVKQLIPIPNAPYQQDDVLFTNCKSWRHFKTFRLTVNQRVNADEQEFAEWLEQLGNGRIRVESGNVLPPFSIPIPPQCVTSNVVNDIYGDVDIEVIRNPGYSLADRVVLTVTNADCSEINNRMIDRFPGNQVTILSVDSAVYDDRAGPTAEEDLYSVEYLNNVSISGIPDHKLILKEGIPIVLLRNLSADDGLMNGTRLVVRRISPLLLTAEISVGVHRGKIVLIPRMDLTALMDDHVSTIKRRQFPVKVCFALTINKSQGQTYERVGIFLRRPVFGHGQLYVAFSRARSFSSVRIQIENNDVQGRLLRRDPRIFTRNVVLRHFLRQVYSTVQN